MRCSSASKKSGLEKEETDSGRFVWEGFHRERNAFAGDVDFQHDDFDVLIHLNDCIGIADITIGQLTDMDEPILIYSQYQ